MSEIGSTERLDIALVARGLVPTRARARDLVLRGRVTVDGRVALKPSLAVGPGTKLDVAADEARMVSRGRLKLEAALDRFGLSCDGLVCLDVGASTGGFSELLLERGAARVYAVDVGTGQLHDSLRADPRVVSLEGQDARQLTPEIIPERPGAIVADVSFISLTKVLPAALALAAPGAWLVALVKPQFEVGPEHVSKTGIVRDPSAREAAVAKTGRWLDTVPGWHALQSLESPIAGGSGNIEYLIGARKDA